MNFIIENTFEIQDGRTRDYQAWLQANEAEIAETCPEGVEYLGTYVTIYGHDPAAGSFRSYWRMDSYAAQDRFAAAMKEGGRFAELVSEATGFVDQRNDAARTSRLHKAMADASIWGE